MGKKKHKRLFNLIAPMYGLFFGFQKKRYKEILAEIQPALDVQDFATAVDFGCGTGAMASALAEKGLRVIGIDQAEKMLKVARKKTKGEGIEYLRADILEPLPIPDDVFDIAFSSYVAHGFAPVARKKMYEEMCRLAKRYVIIHDYNNKRSFPISIAEWLEGGDYFRFRKKAKTEMEDLMKELETCFSGVQVLPVGKHANWYICKAREKKHERKA